MHSDLRPLFDAFTRGPSLLNEAVRGLDSGCVSRRAPGEDWSIRDIVVHISDAELIRATRIRMILAAEQPPALPVFDEQAWQRRLSYLWRSVEGALAFFDHTRSSTAEILAQCDRNGWARTGIHPEEGPLDVRELVQRGVGHIEAHTAQIAAIRAALGG